jgi:hypothetical protein
LWSGNSHSEKPFEDGLADLDADEFSNGQRNKAPVIDNRNGFEYSQKRNQFIGSVLLQHLSTSGLTCP